ncbi:MAG: hypothetical protein K2G40_05565, partial [Muribaculaceae bacterium]|nr:hypothetical protein [Muribaculaceae bacterium]
MKRIANILLALALASPAMIANQREVSASDIRLQDLSLNVDEAAGTVSAHLDLAVAGYNVGKDREMIFTPMLIADDRSDSIMLDEIIVAGRNRWYHYLREGFLDKRDPNIFRSGKPGNAVVDARFPFQPWMSHSSLEMRCATANCCDAPEQMIGPSPAGNVPMARIDLERPTVEIDYVFAPPVDAGPVIKSIEGSAFITFVVNRTELNPTYMKNPAELQKIINSIEFVRKDPDATITSVHIKGFASPEGPYNNNVRLAMGRTETLRKYVRDLYSFPDTTVTSSYEPEDWDGLRSYVADSMNFDITNRADILALIDDRSLAPDDKNSAIQRKYPADYKVLLKEIYPWLRHSDYKVTYAIKVYTDVNEIRKVFGQDPTRLRNVDFYTLAQTYPVGSPEYCGVFETAVEVYPDDPMLNLNAANIELERGDYDKAQSFLLKAGNTPQAHYARGVLAARRNDYNEAIKRFRLAGDAGKPGMDAILEKV